MIPAHLSSWLQTLGRWLLGSALIAAGIAHLTTHRQEFQAQVPKSLPLNEDFVVISSGIAEISLGTAILALPQHQRTLGKVAAAFFVAVFPGNISQYLTRTDAFGLNSDEARAARLAFQPLLVLGALWTTGVWPKRRS